MEWNVLLPLIREGRMPNFVEVMARGTFGELETFVPTFSPVIWTTIATGKVHQKHGIHHFAKRTDGKLDLFDSRDRKTKALWNILSDNGKSVNSIGWWMTWPVEPIDGVMVSQTNTTAQFDTRGGKNIWKGGLVRGVQDQVHPQSRQSEMIGRLLSSEQGLAARSAEIFGEFQYPLTKLGETLWKNCQWAFRADATYLDIALQLATETQPDLTLLYLGGPDVVGHRFWRYMEPGLYDDPPSTEQVANFGDVIADYYAYTDRALGDLLDAYGRDTNVIIVSDHGMHAVNLQNTFDADVPPPNINSGEHQDAPPGIFIAAGPGIQQDGRTAAPDEIARADLPKVGSVLDITPTLLAMFGLPVGQDMDGEVMATLFAPGALGGLGLTTVPTHDTREFFEGRAGGWALDPGEQERLQQLRDLGYIED
jgi:predicted AlkP superfamily pyrophosphatase or phosphodiesterase